MSGRYGLNVDFRFPGLPDLDALAADVAATGATIVRTVLKPGIIEAWNAIVWYDACRANGLDVLWVVARESFQGVLDWGQLATYRGLYGHRLALLQVGNEADHVSDSSWTMSPEDLNSLLGAARRFFPDSTIVGPGLVSGQATFIERVDLSLTDVLALHPYQESPETIDFYLSTYRQYWDGPIWFTEFADVGMTGVLAERGACAIKFCYHPYLGFGLIDAQNHPTPDYQIFKAFAKQGGTMTAIDERAAQLGDKLGEALAPERVIELRVKAFNNALLVDVPGAGVYALAEATVADKFLDRPGR